MTFERRHEWRRGTHECPSARRSGNDGDENAGLSGRGEKLGTARSVHAATKRSAFSWSIDRALGQSGQSPIFRRLCRFPIVFSRVRTLQRPALEFGSVGFQVVDHGLLAFGERQVEGHLVVFGSRVYVGSGFDQGFG